MGSVRFSSIELQYGCHDRSIKLPIKQSPVVISAPNGCGKTTLIEALVRAVFGFDENLPDDRNILEYRRPWAGNGMRLRAELVDDEWGTWRIDRNLADSLLAITSPAGETKSWGHDNEDPIDNPSHQRMTEELTGLFGFDDRHLYESTSCLLQGEQLRTHLSDEVLRVAETSYSRADAARLKLAAAARRWQSGHPNADEEPDADQQSIKELEGRIAALEMSLGQADEIDSRRRALAEQAERLEQNLDKIDQEIEALEQERKPLLDQRAEELEIEQTQERLRDLEGIEVDLERAIATFEVMKKDYAPVQGTHLEFPDDFKSRAERVEELWEDRKHQRKAISKIRDDLRGAVPPPPALIVAATLLAVSGLPAWYAGLGSVAIALSLLGLAAVAVLLVRQRSATGDRARLEGEVQILEGALSEIKEELSELVANIPDGENLRRERLVELVQEFEGLPGEQSRIDDASEEIAAVAAIARRILEKWSKASIPSQPEQLLQQVQKAIIAAREDLENMGEDDSLPDSASESSPSLASLEALEITLDERRQSRDELFEELTDAQRAVVEEGRLAQSPLAARRQLDKSRARLEEVRDRQAALQRASDLIDNACDEYREQDEQRLIDSISHALAALTSGELGPFVLDESLEAPTVKVDQREVPLECPPLGYGEYHAALLAIRIGGAGFLSNLGIRPPFIVDEPFAHLDESRCVQLWQILNRIARERQVIVATYNHLLLDQIGITPDVVLDQPPVHPLFAAC